MGSAYSVMPLLVVTALLAGTPFAAPPEVQQFSALAPSNTASNTPVSLSESDEPEPKVEEERQALRTVATDASSAIKSVVSLFRPNAMVEGTQNVLRKYTSVWDAFDEIYAGSPHFENIAAASKALATVEEDILVLKRTIKYFKWQFKAHEKRNLEIQKDIAKTNKKHSKMSPAEVEADPRFRELAARRDFPILFRPPFTENHFAGIKISIGNMQMKIDEIKLARRKLEISMSDFFDSATFKTLSKQVIKAKQHNTFDHGFAWLLKEFDNEASVVAAVIDSMRQRRGSIGEIGSKLEKVQFRKWKVEPTVIFYGPGGVRREHHVEVPESIPARVLSEFSDFLDGRNRFKES